MDRIKPLRWALVGVGVVFVGASLMGVVWPSGWLWQPHHLYYEEMIFGIYATLGVFLLLAARDPLRNKALSAPEHHGHLIGDVPALFFVAIVLGVLMRRASAPQ